MSARLFTVSRLLPSCPLPYSERVESLCRETHSSCCCWHPLYPSAYIRPLHPKSVISSGALSICLAIYAIVGLFGYLTFFSNVAGNVLLNYEVDDPWVMVGRLGVALVILCSIPLMGYPLLAAIDGLIFKKVFCRPKSVSHLVSAPLL